MVGVVRFFLHIKIFGDKTINMDLLIEEFLSYGFGNPVSCGAHCNLLWDGYGRWTNGTWAPYGSGTTTERNNEYSLSR